MRWDNESNRYVEIKRGVRQGCVISPILFNLYSEFMITEALENESGISINGNNITNLRYADDAVLVADEKEKLQSMLDKLNEVCKAYGMEINVKKTKVMVVCKEGKEQCCVTLDNKLLEQVEQYKYRSG